MSAHPPPVPPDQRPKAGPNDEGHASLDQGGGAKSSTADPDKTGQAGNTRQNTTNKGLQQDR